MKYKLNHWPVYDKCIKILSCVLNTAKALVKLRKKKISHTFEGVYCKLFSVFR